MGSCHMDDDVEFELESIDVICCGCHGKNCLHGYHWYVWKPTVLLLNGILCTTQLFSVDLLAYLCYIDRWHNHPFRIFIWFVLMHSFVG
jgi:hypothetical protein